MCQLEISQEVQRLSDNICRQHFEKNVRNGTSLNQLEQSRVPHFLILTLEHVTANEFRQNVDLVSIDVRNTLNITTRNQVDSGDNECKYYAIHWETSVVNLGHSNAHGENDQNDGRPPIPRNLFVSFHQASVNIELLSALPSVYQVIVMPPIHVGEDRCDTSK